MPDLYVRYENDRSYRNPKELYGEWWASNSYRFIDVSTEKDSWGELVTLIGDLPKAGETLYLVVVTYADGDSFGRETGKTCCVAIYTDLEKAKALEKAIDDDYKAYKVTDSYGRIVGPDGEEIYTGTWKDYFGGMEYVTVETLPFLG